MLTRPDLADEIIIERLQSNYGINTHALTFLPVGNDARAWSFRVESGAGANFLKLRKGAVNRAALAIPHFLNSCGIDSVIAPLPTRSGQLFASADDFSLILFPFVHGASRWGMSLTSAQWREWGAIMRSIHSAPIPPALVADVPQEVFAVKWLDKIERVVRVLAQGEYEGEVAAAVAQVWRENAAIIELCRGRYRSLGAQLARAAPENVICHADIHPANIIVDAAGEIHIVDWDEALLAPKERDLMFFIDDGRAPATTDAFLSGYGDTSADLLALAYYKYDWVIQELGDYGERVFLATDLTADDLALAGREFARLFTPDDVVDRAQRAYANYISG